MLTLHLGILPVLLFGPQAQGVRLTKLKRGLVQVWVLGSSNASFEEVGVSEEVR
jgi:hypothetical protein